MFEFIVLCVPSTGTYYIYILDIKNMCFSVLDSYMFLCGALLCCICNIYQYIVSYVYLFCTLLLSSIPVMHSKCLTTYLESNQYKCPTCRRSVCDMTATWANYKSTISAQAMPEEYQKEVDILCYDCGKDCTAAFHFLGMECEHCGSYNTSSK